MVYNILETPLTIEEIKSRVTLHDGVPYIEGLVIVYLSDAYSGDRDSWFDFLSEKLTGSDIMMDVQYEEQGMIQNGIILKVSGDVTGILETEGN